VPLLQDLLEACFYLAHPEAKDRPCEFDWRRVSTRNLRELEHKRKQKRRGGRASREKRAAAQERYRQRQKARLGEEEFNARRAAEQDGWRRSEPGQRYEERLVQLEYIAARKAKERSKRLGTILSVAALADLEAPEYILVAPTGKRTRESWPLPLDDAARWILAAESLGHRDTGGVLIPLDTAAEKK
jgi:hypothetical protein